MLLLSFIINFLLQKFHLRFGYSSLAFDLYFDFYFHQRLKNIIAIQVQFLYIYYTYITLYDFQLLTILINMFDYVHNVKILYYVYLITYYMDKYVLRLA